ncbi:MAG: gliding motility-associated ABC transporter substrate-binding protein GldG [Nonlabens sp.]
MKNLKLLALVAVGLIILGIVAANFYTRIDLTANQRYTLSQTSKELLAKADQPIIIDVFLAGDLPAEFRRLRRETLQILEELENLHPSLSYEFIEPLEGLNQQESNQVTQQLARNGVRGALATVQKEGKRSQVTVFPYAIILYDGNRTAVPLLKAVTGSSSEDRINASVQQLEYQLMDGIRRVAMKKQKRIAVLKDSGELEDLEIADFLKALQQYYYTAKFGIEYVNDSTAASPRDVLKKLQDYDLVIDPKPTVAFSETKNYVLDQYLLNGGNLLLAIDPVIMENDSLTNELRRAYPLPRDLNIDNLLFSYGLRLNNGLVKSLDLAPLALAVGQGRNIQYEAFPWPYYPLASSSSNSSTATQVISNNLEDVKLEYAGSIDTLKNNVKKSILLMTSPRSQVLTLPAAINLSELQMPENPENYQAGEQPVAVMATGNFKSAYKNKVKPFDLPGHIDQAIKPGNVLLISDGDIMKNQIDRGVPQDLGFDIRTGTSYGNKEFLMNSIEYMLNDTGLIDLRNKDIQIATLDPEEAYGNRLFWQLIIIVLPLALLALFALCFMYVRKKSLR